MDDPGFLPLFSRLGSASGESKEDLVAQLIACLDRAKGRHGPGDAGSQEHVRKSSKPQSGTASGAEYRFRMGGNATKDEARSFIEALEYTVTRLVHGLSSPLECVRHNYAAAICILISHFSKYVSLNELASALSAVTQVPSHSHPSRQKELQLGKVFGSLVLHRLGYFKSKQCLTTLEPTVADLLKLMTVRVALQDAAAYAIAKVVIDACQHSPGVALKLVQPSLASLFSQSTLQSLASTPSLRGQSADRGGPEEGDASRGQAGRSKEAMAAKQRHHAPVGLLSLWLRLHHFHRHGDSASGGTQDCQVWREAFPRSVLKPKERESALTILCHQSAAESLSPNVPMAWVDLLRVVESSFEDEQTLEEGVRSIIQAINDRIFGGGTQETPQPQMVLYGFRVLLDLLAYAMTPRAIHNENRRGAAPLRKALVGAMLGHMPAFWTQLLFHLRGDSKKAARNLQATANGVLELLQAHKRSGGLYEGARSKKGSGVTWADIAGERYRHDTKHRRDTEDSGGEPEWRDAFLKSEGGIEQLVQKAHASDHTLKRFVDLFIGTEWLTIEAKEEALKQLQNQTQMGALENVAFKRLCERWVWLYRLESQLVVRQGGRKMPDATGMGSWLSRLHAALTLQSSGIESATPTPLCCFVELPTFSSPDEPKKKKRRKSEQNSSQEHQINCLIAFRTDGATAPESDLPNFDRLVVGPMIASYTKILGLLLTQQIKQIAGLPREDVETKAAITEAPSSSLCLLKESMQKFGDQLNHVTSFISSSLKSRNRKVTPIYGDAETSSSDSKIEVNICLKEGLERSLQAAVSFGQATCATLEAILKFTTQKCQDSSQLSGCLEMLIALQAFSVFLCVPILLADRTPEVSSEREAALDLMEQLRDTCYPEIVSALQGSGAKSQVTPALRQILQTLSDVIPSILLPPGCAHHSQDPIQSGSGSDASRLAAVRGLLSHVLTAAWISSLATYASPDSVAHLVRNALPNHPESTDDLKDDPDGEGGSELSDDDGSADEEEASRESEEEESEGAAEEGDNADAAAQSNDEEGDEEIGMDKVFDLMMTDDTDAQQKASRVPNPTFFRKEENRRRKHERQAMLQSCFRCLNLLEAASQRKIEALICLASNLNKSPALSCANIECLQIGSNTSSPAPPRDASALVVLAFHVSWLLRLMTEAHQQVTRASRTLAHLHKRANRRNSSPTATLSLSLGLKLHAAAARQCTLILTNLNKWSRPVGGSGEENTKSKSVGAALQSLRSAADGLISQLGKQQRSTGCRPAIAALARCSEDVAVAVLCLGRVEELVLSQLVGDPFELSATCELPNKASDGINSSCTSVETVSRNWVSACGDVEDFKPFVVCDVLTSITKLWIERRRAQVSEHLIRSFVKVTQRYSQSAPVALYSVDLLKIVESDDVKLFMKREITTAHSKIRAALSKRLQHDPSCIDQS